MSGGPLGLGIRRPLRFGRPLDRGTDQTVEIVFHFSSNNGLDSRPGKEELKHKNVIDHLSHRWQTKEMTDVKFKVKEVVIEAHTQIIASCSSVLSAMAQQECKDDGQTIVEIDDFEPNVMGHLLQFIYTGDADFENVTVPYLLVTADKFQMESLKEECTSYVIKNLDVNDVIDWLLLSHHYQFQSLKDAVLKCISENARANSRQKEKLEMLGRYPDLCIAAIQQLAL